MNRSSTPKQVSSAPPRVARKTVRSTDAGGYSRPKVEGGGQMRGVKMSGKKAKAGC